MRHIDKYSIGIGVLFFLTSCQLSTETMTRQTFDRISLGASIESVEESAGPPYQVIAADEGDMLFYQYLERVQVGPQNTCQNTYVLTVVDGQVVAKRLEGGSSLLSIQIP